MKPNQTNQEGNGTNETNSDVIFPFNWILITKWSGYFRSSFRRPNHGLPFASVCGQSSAVRYFLTLLWCHTLAYSSTSWIKGKKMIIRNRPQVSDLSKRFEDGKGQAFHQQQVTDTTCNVTWSFRETRCMMTGKKRKVNQPCETFFVLRKLL